MNLVKNLGASRLLILMILGLYFTIHAGAHGMDPAIEIAAREEFALSNAVNLVHCADKLERDGVFHRAILRRSVLADIHSGNDMVDPDDVLNTDHEENSVNINSTKEEIFATRDDGCVLMPEVTEGPFYIEGQYIRSNLRDGEPGITMVLDLQIIDTETCDPVEDQYVEVWHTNALGIYSGDSVRPDSEPTFGRGVALTDGEGAVSFRTLIPGHYGGRTPHIHIMTHHPDHAEAIKGNDTLQNNVATHAGQLYFDQKLVDAVRELRPYNANRQGFVTNARDALFRQAAAVSDPVLSYFFLNRNPDPRLPGGKVDRGIVAWKLVGVNMTNVRNVWVSETFHPED